MTVRKSVWKGRLDIATHSTIGDREEQQDAMFFTSDESAAIVALCDGMGGLANGQLASTTAVKTLEMLFARRDETQTGAEFYVHAVETLDENVCTIRRTANAMQQVGTTIVSAFISQGELFWLSIGDSRMYLVRGNEIVCVTTDHNYRYLLDQKFKHGRISTTEYSKEVIRGNALISYLGMGGIELVDHNKTPFVLKQEDIIILASDGLYQNVTSDELYRTVRQHESARDISENLIRIVENKHRQNQDNASVVVVKVLEG